MPLLGTCSLLHVVHEHYAQHSQMMSACTCAGRMHDCVQRIMCISNELAWIDITLIRAILFCALDIKCSQRNNPLSTLLLCSNGIAICGSSLSGLCLVQPLQLECMELIDVMKCSCSSRSTIVWLHAILVTAIHGNEQPTIAYAVPCFFAKMVIKLA